MRSTRMVKSVGYRESITTGGKFIIGSINDQILTRITREILMCTMVMVTDKSEFGAVKWNLEKLTNQTIGIVWH